MEILIGLSLDMTNPHVEAVIDICGPPEELEVALKRITSGWLADLRRPQV